MGQVMNRLKRFLLRPADVLKPKISGLLMHDPRLSGTFYPHRADQDSFILLNTPAKYADRHCFELPIPPQGLWAGYGVRTEDFLNSGKVDVHRMNEILHSSEFRIQDGNRVLDFGCASGRMIRFLADVADRCEVWGVDISARHIIWCQEHLSPPFNFATVTTAPHLPFEDAYFDLIYSGSVFTHIADLADAWLLELKRIIKPGGRLYITIHDKHTIELITNSPERVYSDGLPVEEEFRNLLLSFNKKVKFSSLDFYMFTIGRGPSSQVFYNADHLYQHWGRILKICSVNPEAYGYQTAIVLEK
jgi:ubiquinone/menaquinone biosynthesis C-methylase UbiE